jgi:hypothetical protein
VFNPQPKSQQGKTMSIQAVKWSLSAKVGPIEKLALVAIAESHNAKTGKCFPSQAYVANVIGQKERSARTHICKLEKDGFFTRKHRYDGQGHRTSDDFILHFNVTEPTGNMVAGSKDRLPEKSDPPTGNTVAATDVPESLVPEERAPQAAHARSESNQGKGRLRPTTIPDDWQPSAQSLALAKSLGLDGGQIAYVVGDFKKKQRAKGKTWIDWNTPFDDWMKGEIKYKNGAANVDRLTTPSAASANRKTINRYDAKAFQMLCWHYLLADDQKGALSMQDAAQHCRTVRLPSNDWTPDQVGEGCFLISGDHRKTASNSPEFNAWRDLLYRLRKSCGCVTCVEYLSECLWSGKLFVPYRFPPVELETRKAA